MNIQTNPLGFGLAIIMNVWLLGVLLATKPATKIICLLAAFAYGYLSIHFSKGTT